MTSCIYLPGLACFLDSATADGLDSDHGANALLSRVNTLAVNVVAAGLAKDLWTQVGCRCKHTETMAACPCSPGCGLCHMASTSMQREYRQPLRIGN